MNQPNQSSSSADAKIEYLQGQLSRIQVQVKQLRKQRSLVQRVIRPFLLQLRKSQRVTEQIRRNTLNDQSLPTRVRDFSEELIRREHRPYVVLKNFWDYCICRKTDVYGHSQYEPAAWALFWGIVSPRNAVVAGASVTAIIGIIVAVHANALFQEQTNTLKTQTATLKQQTKSIEVQTKYMKDQIVKWDEQNRSLFEQYNTTIFDSNWPSIRADIRNNQLQELHPDVFDNLILITERLRPTRIIQHPIDDTEFIVSIERGTILKELATEFENNRDAKRTSRLFDFQSRLNLEKAKVDGFRFQFVKFMGLNLRNLYAARAEFHDSDLRGADFTNAVLSDARFDDCDFFIRDDLEDISLKILHPPIFNGADLRRAKILFDPRKCHPDWEENPTRTLQFPDFHNALVDEDFIERNFEFNTYWEYQPHRPEDPAKTRRLRLKEVKK